MSGVSLASWRSIAALAVAVVAGIGLGALDTNPTFDDTGVLVVGLGASAAAATMLLDRPLATSIAVGLIPGLGVALVEITRSGVAVALVSLGVAGVGGLAGYAGGRIAGRSG